MAIPIRFECEYVNAQGNNFKVRILDVDHVAGVNPFNMGGDTFSINYHSDATGQNRFATMATSQCAFEMHYNGQNSTINAFVADLIQFQEDRFYVEIARADDAIEPIVWRGKIVQDLLKHGDILNSRFLSITATDGLNSLDAVDIDELPGQLIAENFVEFVIQSLKFALPVAFWATDERYLRTCLRWFEDQHANATIDPFRHSRFRFQDVLWSNNSDGERTYKTVKEGLEIVLKAWGAKLFQSDGCWNVVHVAQYKLDTADVAEYTYEYAMFNNDPDDDDQAGATILNEDLAYDITRTPTTFINGGEYTYLPALKSVEVHYRHENLDLIGGGLHIDLDDLNTTGITIPDVNSYGTKQLHIELTTILPGNLYGPGAPGAQAAFTYDAEYTIKNGSYYLKNDFTWTTTPTIFIQTLTVFDDELYLWGDSGPGVGSNILTTFPTSIGSLQITLEDVEIYSVTGTPVLVDMTVYTTVSVSYSPEDINSETTFLATNADATKSSTKIDLGEVYLGDYPNSSKKYALEVWTGTAWAESEVWKFEDTGTAYTFGELLVLDYLRGQKRPLLKYMGALMGDISFFHSIARNGRTFMFMSGEFNGEHGTWRGEWVETDYDITSITLPDPVQGFEQAAFKPAISGYFKTSNDTNTINSIATVQTEIASGATVTSITFANLTNDLTSGYSFTIVNPTTGAKQQFTTTATATAGAEVSVSVTSAESTSAFPIGSHVLITGSDVLVLAAESVGGGATSLADLSDVDASVADPADGNILVYRSAGADWVLEEKPAGGSSPAIADITDVTITSVADNEVLAYNTATGEWINQTAAEAGLAAASHTHAATDVTSGTFNNARIAEGNVTQHQAALVVASTQVTGLGTLATKSAVNNADWSGTDLAIANGGTGASIAADARTNLGLAIGTNVQAYSAILDATTASYTAAKDTKLSGIETGADVTDASNVLAAGAVIVTTDQTIAGIKTFSSFPISPTAAPTTDYQLANKKYVDDSITAAGGYTDEAAQDAVGLILADTATIDLTYTDATPAITADVKDVSIGLTKLSVGVQGSISLADSAIQPADLSTVAITGLYNDLSGKPTLGSLAALSTVNDANWSGTDLSVANGGTGSSTASGARTNLGLGTAATTAATDYATAAQGTKADSALQPAAIGVTVQGYSAALAGTTASYTTTLNTKLNGIEAGAEVNNISDVNATDLTDLGESTLHYHASDRARANHTGTQAASTISDFAAAVAATASVTANTAKVTNATHTGDVTGATALTIAADAVTNAKAANMAVNTIKGRITAGTGDPEDLTAANVRTIINVANGATANSSDATLLARANHTGTQDAATITGTKTGAFISDFNEAAQDAVGGIFVDSAEIDFTYSDAAPSITASIVAGSIDEAKLDVSVNASLDKADSASQPGHQHVATDITDFKPEVVATKYGLTEVNTNFTASISNNGCIVECKSGLDTITLPALIAGMHFYVFNNTGGTVTLSTPDFGITTVANGTMCEIIGLPTAGWYASQM